MEDAEETWGGQPARDAEEAADTEETEEEDDGGPDGRQGGRVPANAPGGGAMLAAADPTRARAEAGSGAETDGEAAGGGGADRGPGLEAARAVRRARRRAARLRTAVAYETRCTARAWRVARDG